MFVGEVGLDELLADGDTVDSKQQRVLSAYDAEVIRSSWSSTGRAQARFLFRAKVFRKGSALLALREC